MSDSILTIITPYGPRSSTCGYCGLPGERSAAASSWHVAGLTPVANMSCGVYQTMIDRGWRRSGVFCYKPYLQRSCCPQYTIKLDALQFKPSKSQRKLLSRWTRFAMYGDDKDVEMTTAGQLPEPAKRPKTQPPFELISAVHASEHAFATEGEPKHKFEVTLEPSSFTKEKYDLYAAYQDTIHLDDDTTMSGFKRFLVDSALHREPINYSTPPPEHLPAHYGAYHQMYRLNGALIAMGVIDILPSCVSSVYFMYDQRWARFSLGKLSAMREAALAREIHEAGVPTMDSLYMGFYIHSCQKMRYKGEYSPSYLADPEDYAWHPLETCKRLLDEHRYACFSHPEHSLAGPPTVNPTQTHFGPIQTDEIKQMLMLDGIVNGVVECSSLQNAEAWGNAGATSKLTYIIHALGIELAKRVIFDL